MRKITLTPEVEGRRTMEDRVKGKLICSRVVVLGVVFLVAGLGLAIKEGGFEGEGK